MRKIGIFAFSAFAFFSFFCFAASAEEIKIVFTGQSFASLYPCSCPHNPEGGVLRRATVIKKIRASSKNVIVVEAGSSFALSSQDEGGQNFDLDSRRTEVYLKALKEMGYDALLVESQEMAFGSEYLKRYPDIPFLASNIKDFSPAVIIKEAGKIKVGILGIADESLKFRGAWEWQDPADVLAKEVAALKKKGVDLVIVLSSLKPSSDAELLKKIKGIDVVINGSPSYGSVHLEEVQGAITVSTWWQAKGVGVLTLDVTSSKITSKNLEALSLGADISDDEALAPLVPACFRAADCKRVADMASACENASTPSARCIYTSLPKVSVTVIHPRICRTCHSDEVIASLKSVFGSGLAAQDIFEDDPLAVDLIKEFKITMLPAYIFDKKIEASEVFGSFNAHLDKGKDGYMLKPVSAGVSYFLNRSPIPKRLDVFFDFSYTQLPQLFKSLKAFGEKHNDIDIQFHFLAISDTDGSFVSKGGAWEIEEFKRAACVAELYPKGLLDYLSCRSLQKESSWWDACAPSPAMDPSKIKACVFSDSGRQAFLKRIQLTQALQIAVGPTFLIDNNEVFGIINAPTVEDFEKTVLNTKKEDKK